MMEKHLNATCEILDHAYKVYGTDPALRFFGWDERLCTGFEIWYRAASPEAQEAQNAYKMLSIRMWSDFAAAMGAYGRADLQAKYNGYAEAKMAELRKNRAWHSQFGLHALAEVAASGLLNDVERKAIAEKEFLDRVTRLSFDPFCQLFINQAMARLNLYDEAFSSIRDVWGGIIKLGGTTPWECYRPSWNSGVGVCDPVPHSAEKPLFPEPRKFLGPVKMGAPHFVDFGKNMEHSPDGKAYLIGMGAEENDPKPRPCIKPGKPGETYQVIEGCTNDFAHANLSWVTADQAYLARVTPSPETINDPKAYEFFAGHDSSGQPVWTRDFKKIKPLVEWNNHMGCVTATYVPGLKKYLMCVTDGWPTVAKMTSYILEADKITGPWRMVSYMKNFGEQAYFLNFPSKFISPDGRKLWLCYSANFSPGWNGVKLNINPPGGRYDLCLHEVKLLKPAAPSPDRP